MNTVKMEVKIKRDLIQGITKAGSRKATWSALDYLAQRSKEQVPLDTGMLKASCAVDVNDDGSQGAVSYDTPYAVRWHEENANFQRGRKRKYLEDPLNDSGVQKAMSEIAQREFQGEIR